MPAQWHRNRFDEYGRVLAHAVADACDLALRHLACNVGSSTMRTLANVRTTVGSSIRVHFGSWYLCVGAWWGCERFCLVV